MVCNIASFCRCVEFLYSSICVCVCVCVCLICSSSTSKSNAFNLQPLLHFESFYNINVHTQDLDPWEFHLYLDSLDLHSGLLRIIILASHTPSCTILVWIEHFLVAAYIAFYSKDTLYVFHIHLEPSCASFILEMDLTYY